MSALVDLKTDLAKFRDEPKVQEHLGTMETKQDREENEAKWNRFGGCAGLKRSGDGIKGALQGFGKERRGANQRLKRTICAAYPLQFRALSPTLGGRRTPVKERPNDRPRRRQDPA